MKLTVEFQGGPLDGWASLERDIQAGEKYSFQEFAIMLAAFTSGYRCPVGHRFRVPSLGWLTRTVVRRRSDQPGPMDYDSFEDEITQREEVGEEMMLVVRALGQRP